MTDPSHQNADRLNRELTVLSRHLRRRVFTLGLARCLSVGLPGIFLLFLLDILVTPPFITRLVLTAALIVVMVFAFRRFLLRPLALVFTPELMAIALERHFPALKQSLISSIQLAETKNAPGTSTAMVNQILAEAEAQFADLRGNEIFNPRPTRHQGLVVFAAAVLLCGTIFTYPAAVGTWLQRLVGINAIYPRATRLTIKLPESGPSRRVDQEAGLITMARGADLPIGVKVAGLVPPAVRLVGNDGSLATMAPVDQALFRHTYRSIESSFTFHATGGDDPHGDRSIRVVIIDAPAVESIAQLVTPPAYTDSSPTANPGGHVEALTGSTVRITITPNRPVKRAELHFDSLVKIPMQPVGDGNFAGTFNLTTNDRYRVRLAGENQLQNVNPGTYMVIAVPDTAPVVSMAAPGLASSPYTLKGFVPVRCRIKDDFGLRRGIVRIVAPGGKNILLEKVITWNEEATGTPRDRVLVTMIPISEIKGKGDFTPSAGDTCLLRLLAEDNRLPKPGQGGTRQDWRLNLVEENELKRQASDRMRRRRTEVESALRVQQELLHRLEAAMELDPGKPARHAAIQGIHNGQSRLASLVSRVRIGFCRVFDFYLFGGTDLIDPATASAIRAAYTTFYRQQNEQEPYTAAFYRDQWRQKQQGTRQLSAHPGLILDLVHLTCQLEQDTFPRLSKALSRSLSATAARELEKSAAKAFAAQQETVLLLTKILNVLQEWDEFDDVLKKLRVLKESQISIWGRTRERLTKPGEGNQK